MKPTARRILNLTVVLSLVLWIVFASLWIRGFWASDGFTHMSQKFVGTHNIARSSSLVFDCNRLAFLWHVYTPLPLNPPNEPPKLVGADIRPYSRLERHAGPPASFQIIGGTASDPFLNRLGFTYRESQASPESWVIGYMEKEWAIPFWLPLILLAILPAYKLTMIQQWRRNRRQKQGRCVMCGYDLRATPERCPECGAIPTGFQRITQ